MDTKRDPIYERDQKSTTTKIKKATTAKYLPHELIACFRVNSKKPLQQPNKPVFKCYAQNFCVDANKNFLFLLLDDNKKKYFCEMHKTVTL